MQHNIRYRTMKSGDYEQSMMLWKSLPGLGLSGSDSKNSIKAYLNRNKNLSHVALLGKKVIGTIICGTDGRRAYIYHLAVDKDHQKSGIGRKLVELSFKKLKKLKIEKAHIFVFKDNVEGQIFWEKTGWLKRDDLAIFSYIL